MRRNYIPIALVLASATLAHADFNPIALQSSSFTGDAVVEKTAPRPVGAWATATIDNGTNIQTGTGSCYGDTWHEQGLFTATPTYGLPQAGSTFPASGNANIQYTMPPTYATNNGVLIDNSVATCSLALVTPAAYSSLSFLSSGGNGGRVINVTIYYADGSTSAGSFASPDWFNGNVEVAWVANGRCNAATHTLDNANTGNPRLYSREVAANPSLVITNIVLSNGTSGSAGSHVGIFAVSGATGGSTYAPIAVTGYNQKLIIPANATLQVANHSYTTITMDGGTNNNGNTWYEQGYDPIYPLSGLPAAGSTISSVALPDHHYTLPATYAGNNAIYVDISNTVANIAFAPPYAPYSALSFLSATANGNVTNSCTMQYADGSSETQNFVSHDWFNNTPYAYNAEGRVSVDSQTLNNVNLPTATSGNPRLYEAQFVLANVASPVTNVVLTWVGGANTSSRAFIFAVSGTAGAVPPILGSSPTGELLYQGSNFVLSASVSAGTGPFTYHWQKGTNGVFVNLKDTADLTGTSTPTLTDAVAALADSGDYRVAISNAAGGVFSGVATILVLSTNIDVITPGDPVTAVNANSPTAEDVSHAIDGQTSKYLNFNLNAAQTLPVGFIVTPSLGSTFVTGFRLFTANDSTERDPANTIIEGSNDGGSHWTTIWSNTVALPDGRNTTTVAVDPLSQFMIEVNFANSKPYAVYRWTTSALKNQPAANSMQIGEVQLLGYLNPNPAPIFVQQPVSATVYAGGFATFTGYATGSPNPTFYWLKGTNGVFVPLTDSANVTGSQTVSVTVNPATFNDAADYVLVASNSYGPTYSSPAHLSVISTLTDVTQPTDAITAFGDTSGTFWGTTANPGNAIDNATTKYQNGGSGFSAPAGFPPFAGPVGLVITPAYGRSLVTGLRIYTADGNSERDPADYTLEGSNDGVTYRVISTGALSLPLLRNAGGALLDPLSDPLQEILFANAAVYTSYRITFNHTRSDNVANSLQFAELELLGVAYPTFNLLAAGTTPGALTLVTTSDGTLWATPSLTAPITWTNAGSFTAGTNTIPIGTDPASFYRFSVP